ncbi:hypothetical protein [Spiroplasma endosymbiont of Stenodema calcarata]|uniref:hypothetical protein n=1 Tax=Spiroplasma endosymbiont of Stenodema calcarata TaxID=3139328 RepID=UPI003CCB4DE2
MKKILANLLVLSVAITPTISLVNCKMVREENKKIIEDELPSLPSNFTITQGDIYPSFGINKEEGSQNYFFNPISDQLRTLFLNIPQRKIAPLGLEKDLTTINDFRMYLEYPFAATFKIVSDRELSLDKDQMVSVTLSVKCLKIKEKWSVGGCMKNEIYWHECGAENNF